MNEQQINYLKDALKLVYDFRLEEPSDIKTQALTTGFYKKRPLFFYIQFLVAISPKFREEYVKLTRATQVVKRYIKREPGIIEQFLSRCYWKRKGEYDRLTNLPTIHYFSPTEEEQLRQAQSLPDSPAKKDAFAQLLNQKKKQKPLKTLDEIAGKITNPNNISDTDKDKAASLLKQKIDRYGQRLADPKWREWLLERGELTELEFWNLVKFGLVRLPDLEPEFYKTGIKDEEERAKALREAAEETLKNSIQKRKAAEAKITADLNLNQGPSLAEKLKNIRVPESVKNVLSKPLLDGFSLLKIQARRNLPTLIGGGIGGVTGWGITSTAGGAEAGLIGGGVLGKFVQQGGGKLLMGTGARLALGAVAGPVGWVATAASFAPAPIKKGVKKVIIFAIVAPLALIFLNIGDFQKNFTLLPPPELAESAPLEQPLGGITGGGGSCPDTSNNINGFSCQYLNPAINLAYTPLLQSSVDAYINKYSPTFIQAGKGDLTEFKKRVEYILQKSQQGKMNPAIFLGYWKTESLFSTLGSRDMGCAGADFYEQVRCALAIDDYNNPNKNPIANCVRGNNIACNALKSIRTDLDKTHPIHYPITTFDDFAEAYGPYNHLTEGQPTNCTHTYNQLIEVAKELGACQASSITPPAGDLRLAIKNKFHINLDNSFEQKHLNWAWQILTNSETSAPNFLTLLQRKYSEINVATTGAVGFRSENTIYFSTREGSFFVSGGEKEFKQILIHELAHIIHGVRTDNTYTSRIEDAVQADRNFISGYAQGATAQEVVCEAADSKERAVQLDEDFADSVSYYINKETAELNYSNVCPAKATVNPFATGQFPAHKAFIKILLGGNY